MTTELSFWKQLLADAKPKAEVIAKATQNITINAYNSKTVKVVRGLTYNTVVNTTAGVMAGTILAEPITNKVKGLGERTWSAIEKLAEQPTTSERK